MIPLSYLEKNNKSSFVDLIRPLGRFVSNDTLEVDAAIGSGSIRIIDIEDGLQVRIWDCTFKKGFDINRQPLTDDTGRNFTIVYYLTHGTFSLKDAPLSNNISQVWNTVLMSNDAQFDVSISGGKPMKCVSLAFSAEWLGRHIFSDIDFNDHFFKKNIDEKKAVILFESMANTERELANGLLTNKFHPSFGKFFFRSKALNLLTDFFTKIRNRDSVYQGTTLYREEQINEAAKKIDQHINNTLPNLKSLAKELSISESTLKRYFRKIYGKNISAYFFEKKMEYAKQLLTTHKSTVTEVAYMVGYEKPSQFTRMFKRYYGIRPGTFKQMRIYPSL